MEKEVRNEDEKERKMSEIQQQHLYAFEFLPQCECEAWPMLHQRKRKA